MLRRLAVVLVGALLAIPAAATAAIPSHHPMETAFLDPFAFGGPQGDLAFEHAADGGTTAARLQLAWISAVAGKRPPRRPTDPGDPAYGPGFAFFDAQVKLAKKHHIEPIVYIEAAPKWGLAKSHGFLRPDPKKLAEFAYAAAKRYSGRYRGLPRVRYWQVLNEPNKVANPALKASAPEWYRDVVAAFADAVHRVHKDNVVIAGGLSPFGKSTAVAPLNFMRTFLCMSKGAHPKPTCKVRVPFEIWSTHPYTTGGPTHSAGRPDDVSLGDLPRMRVLLDAAVKAHHVRSQQPVRFWVTEFSWDTKPPDRGGVPLKLHARWVSEALYRMWSAGVSMCVWFRLNDDVIPATPYQSGLYFRGLNIARDRPKLSLQAFRFPFVAFREDGHVTIWGRTPGGARGKVIVEGLSGASWKKLATLTTDRYGIFTGVVPGTNLKFLRAQFASEDTTSIPFSLKVPPDHPYQPFGSE